MSLTIEQINNADVIWKPGELHCQDFIIDEKTSVNKIPVNQYLDDNPDCIRCSNDYFMIETKKLENENFLTDWIEIDEDRYYEMLEVLPPEKWKGGCFRMCEYYTSNITSHFIQINQRYFEAKRRTSQDYPSMIKEIHTQFDF